MSDEHAEIPQGPDGGRGSERVTRRRFLGRVAEQLGAGLSVAAGLGPGGCAGARLVDEQWPAAPRCKPSACTTVDVHCHAFNTSDLNVQGFITHVLPLPRKLTDPVARQLHRLTDTFASSGKDELKALANLPDGSSLRAPAGGTVPSGLQEIARELAAVISLSGGGGSAERVLETLALAVRPRREVAATLVETYPSVDLFTPSLVDYTYWSKDRPETSVDDQLRVQEVLARASVRGRFEAPERGHGGVRIHPFAPFNPLREVKEVITMSRGSYDPLELGVGGDQQHVGSYRCDAPLPEGLREPGQPGPKGALGRLRIAVEAMGFIGVKVYPPTGFLPLGNGEWSYHQRSGLGADLDRALLAFYAWCEAEEVPILTHASNSNGYALGQGVLGGAGPWDRVLERFPRLRLDLGHFGHLEGDHEDGRDLEACELWMRQIGDLMERYPHVYADVGYSHVPIEVDYQERWLDLVEDLFERYPASRRRVMYGSDFWLNTLSANHSTAVDAFQELFRRRFPELRQDLMGGNALRFLGFVPSDRETSGGTRNAARLRRWYGEDPLPSWLAA